MKFKKFKRFLRKWFEFPLFDNQFQKDISFWIEVVRFKKHRRTVYGIRQPNGTRLDWKKFLKIV